MNNNDIPTEDNTFSDVYIDDLRRLLNEDVPNTMKELEDALRACMKLVEPILTARIDAQTDLLHRRQQYLHPKDKDLTDVDRKVFLDFHTREYQAKFEVFAGLEKLLEQRIDIIKTLLSV